LRQGVVVHSVKGQGQTRTNPTRSKGQESVLRQGSIVHSVSGRDKPYTQLRAGINRSNGKVDQQSRQLRAETTEYTVKKGYHLKGLSHEIDFKELDLTKGRGWCLNFLGAPMIL
jgi:hypothetical protein